MLVQPGRSTFLGSGANKEGAIDHLQRMALARRADLGGVMGVTGRKGLSWEHSNRGKLPVCEAHDHCHDADRWGARRIVEPCVLALI